MLIASMYLLPILGLCIVTVDGAALPSPVQTTPIGCLYNGLRLNDGEVWYSGREGECRSGIHCLGGHIAISDSWECFFRPTTGSFAPPLSIPQSTTRSSTPPNTDKSDVQPSSKTLTTPTTTARASVWLTTPPSTTPYGCLWNGRVMKEGESIYTEYLNGCRSGVYCIGGRIAISDSFNCFIRSTSTLSTRGTDRTTTPLPTTAYRCFWNGKLIKEAETITVQHATGCAWDVTCVSGNILVSNVACPPTATNSQRVPSTTLRVTEKPTARPTTATNQQRSTVRPTALTNTYRTTLGRTSSPNPARSTVSLATRSNGCVWNGQLIKEGESTAVQQGSGCKVDLRCLGGPVLITTVICMPTTVSNPQSSPSTKRTTLRAQPTYQSTTVTEKPNPLRTTLPPNQGCWYNGQLLLEGQTIWRGREGECRSGVHCLGGHIAISDSRECFFPPTTGSTAPQQTIPRSTALPITQTTRQRSTTTSSATPPACVWNGRVINEHEAFNTSDEYGCRTVVQCTFGRIRTWQSEQCRSNQSTTTSTPANTRQITAPQITARQITSRQITTRQITFG